MMAALRYLFLLGAVWIYVDGPVATLQLDLATAGTVSLSPGVASKQLATSSIPGGVRAIVFGLNQDTVSGHILISTAPVTRIDRVVAANPDGSTADIRISTVSSPSGVRIWVERE